MITPKTIFSSNYYSCRMLFKDTGRRTATYEYTGAEIMPEIDLSYCGNAVTTYQPGRDYTLTYSENMNIGYETGTVTLNGIGNYSGTDTIHFTIKGPLPEPDVIPDQQYTGSYVVPEVNIPGLTRNVDYYVSYSDNYLPGQATVTFTGVQCYEGYRTLNFSIYRKLPAIYTIADQKYTGSEIKPYVYIPGAKEGTDYTVIYYDNIAIGTATVTATGIGYYTGTQTTTFNITNSDSTDFYDDGLEDEGNDDEHQTPTQPPAQTRTQPPALAPTIKLNAYSIPLKVGQSTGKIKVFGLQEGDSVQSWSSSNKKIVTVNKTGVIKAGRKTGTAYITIRTDYGATACIKVKVQKKKVTAKKISVVKSVTLKKGKRYSLNTLVTPITTPDKIKYKSAKKKIASVSGKGVITAKRKGTTTITVTCGKKKVKIKVRVK